MQLTQNEVSNQLFHAFPTAAPSSVAEAIAMYRFRDAGEWLVNASDVETIHSLVANEVTAREWIKSNPLTALKAVVDNARASSEVLGELDCALYQMADAYDKWADGLPMPADNTSRVYAEWSQRRVGAHAKSKRLRDLAKALEVTR